MYNEFSYDYSYMEPAAESTLAGVGGFMLVFVLLFYLLMVGLAVVMYVFNALGMYTIAKRRGIHHPWLSWVPVGDVWILGSISDQYQYVAKGRVRNRRKVLLGLTIAILATTIPVFAMAFVAGFTEAAGMDQAEVLFGSALAVMLLAYVAMMVLAVILAVFQYIALYDLYTSCDPNNSVMFLILSIFFGIASFFVFACRKKDLGMPPRKQPELVQPVIAPVQQPTWQPAVEQEPVAEAEPVAEEIPAAEEASAVGETPEQPE